MSVELLTEHHLELLSFKRDYTGSSESTLVKMLSRPAHMCLSVRGKAQTSLLSYTETSLNMELLH